MDPAYFLSLNSLSDDPHFRGLISNLRNNGNRTNQNTQPIRFDPGYTDDGDRYAIIGASDDDNDHYESKQQRKDDKEQQKKEAELLRRHKEREAELQRQTEEDRRRYEQQMREQERLFEIERQKKEEAQTNAEHERLERERIQKESDKNTLMSELEMIYCKMSDVHIPNIQRLNGEIQSKYENEYLLNYKELKKENDRLNEYHMDILNDPTIQQLLLLGRTGDGKSTFGNRLCGDHSQYGDSGPFQTGLGVHSVTSQIKRHTVRNKRISIVDTPGIFDTNNNDNFHLNEVIEHLRGANGINAFIMCCRAGRLDIKYQEMLQNLESMLTPMFWSNVIVVVTYCQDQYAMHWESSLQRDLWQTINRKLNLRANVFKPYQIIGVNNNDRNSYTRCITELLRIVNDPYKFNQRRFKSDKLVSPIDKLKTKTLCIEHNIQSLMSERENHKSEMTKCKGNLSQTINKCSAFQIDSKYANCINIVDGILRELANNNCILHDLSGIHYNNHNHNDIDVYQQQQQLSEDQLNIIQSQFDRLEMAEQKSNRNNESIQYSVPCALKIKRVLGEGPYHPRQRRQCGWHLINKSHATVRSQCKLMCIDDGDAQQHGLKVQTKPYYDLCVRPNRTCFVQIEVTAPRIADSYFSFYNLIDNDGTIIADTLTIECNVNTQ